jgi:hypothetical protein
MITITLHFTDGGSIRRPFLYAHLDSLHVAVIQDYARSFGKLYCVEFAAAEEGQQL